MIILVNIVMIQIIDHCDDDSDRWNIIQLPIDHIDCSERLDHFQQQQKSFFSVSQNLVD